MSTHLMVAYAALRGLRVFQFDEVTAKTGWRIAHGVGKGRRLYYAKEVREWRAGPWAQITATPDERQWHELPLELADKLTQELIDSIC